jgi:hypothetical protein
MKIERYKDEEEKVGAVRERHHNMFYFLLLVFHDDRPRVYVSNLILDPLARHTSTQSLLPLGPTC